MEDYQGQEIDPALWFYVPLSRANVLGLVKAAEAGLDAMDERWSGEALGAIGMMQDWLREVSTQRFADE